mmetsp:Transcript_7733/g.10345  ORF Transcript_7733/g.10345 Transcript_7733/m.10345 type:complete len:253 (+) Transcript_7733:65-823(+)
MLKTQLFTFIGNQLRFKTKLINIATNDFKLMFLRCEVFNADLAAKRYVKYWDKRVEHFGPEKAFKKISLSDANAGDEETMDLGVISLLGKQDDQGRSILIYDPSKYDKSKYTTSSMIRTFWYVVHSALEVEETQKHGMIFLGDVYRAKLSQFDREVSKGIVGSISGALPIRMSAIHIVHPPTFFRIVFAFLKLVMSKRLLKRIYVHSGDDQKVLAEFEAKFGIAKDKLPTTIGGSLVLDHHSWIKMRRDSGL